MSRNATPFLLALALMATACIAPPDREPPAKVSEPERWSSHRGDCAHKADDGTRLDSLERGCLRHSGRSYDVETLQSTGAMTVGEALRRLDPSLR